MLFRENRRNGAGVVYQDAFRDWRRYGSNGWAAGKFVGEQTARAGFGTGLSS